jgi:hypothetical protein
MESYFKSAKLRATKMYESLKGQSDFILLLISIFSSVHGLITLGVLFPTIDFLFPVEVFFKSNNDPADYASLESSLAGISFLIGVVVALLSLTGSQKRAKNPIVLGVGIIFWIVLFGISIYYTCVRSSKLGYFYDTAPWLFGSKETCRDIDWRTGCPTSRLKYKRVDDKLEIDNLFANDKGEIGKGGKNGKPDDEYCEFNAYDNTTTKNTTKKLGFDDKSNLPTGQKLLDWSLEKYYNPNIEEGSNDGDDMDAIANTIFIEQNADGKCEDDYLPIGATPPFTSKRCLVKGKQLPDISWCWHWGCDQVCNERFVINNLWWISSLISTFFYLLLAILSAAAFGAVRQESLSSAINGNVDGVASYRYKRVNRMNFELDY